MMITSKVLKEFQKEALRSLTGEWVIMGGAVLHLLNINERITLDIDLARKTGQTDETLALLKITDKLKLPLSSINQAGAFFLRQISDWEMKLIVCAENKKCRILRPNGTLYLQLKIKRMSESDQQDCLQMIKYCKKHQEELDISLLKKEITLALKSADPEVEKRLVKLSSNL